MGNYNKWNRDEVDNNIKTMKNVHQSISIVIKHQMVMQLLLTNVLILVNYFRNGKTLNSNVMIYYVLNGIIINTN